jgi:hypothetical protein
MFARIVSYARELPAVLAWLRGLLFGAAVYRRGDHDARGPKWHDKNET